MHLAPLLGMPLSEGGAGSPTENHRPGCKCMLCCCQHLFNQCLPAPLLQTDRIISA